MARCFVNERFYKTFILNITLVIIYFFSYTRICDGSIQESERCNEGMCKVVSVWGQWGPWSSCSRPCNVGTKTRSRQCPGAKYPHIKCGSDKFQTMSCNLQPCQYSEWTQWGEWSKCTGSNLRQVRKRACISFDRVKCRGTFDIFSKAFSIMNIYFIY